MEELVGRLHGLLEPDTQLQRAGLAYLEWLKAADTGWCLCVDALLSPTLDAQQHVQFYCLQVVEHFVQNRYPVEMEATAPDVRRLLSGWLDKLKQCAGAGRPAPAPYVRNKVAQLFAEVFVLEFPARWPTFLLELLALDAAEPLLVDHCLRTLLQIDQLIVDREVVHPEPVARRNTLIRDTLRETSVPRLADWWLATLTAYSGSSQPHICCLALEAIGKYASWIEIALVANDRLVAVVVGLLSAADVREAAADCLHDILRKGMEPARKLRLVDALFAALQLAHVFDPIKVVNDDTSTEEVDYLCRLGRLLSCMLTELTDAHERVLRLGGADADAQLAPLVAAIGTKLPHLLAFLDCDYDDVSGAVVDAVRQYAQLLKARRPLSAEELAHVRTMTLIVVRKLQYDAEFDFQAGGEEEAMFQEYRKRLKVLYDNLAGVERELVLQLSREYIGSTLQRWRAAPVPEVEAAITLLHMLAEVTPPAGPAAGAANAANAAIPLDNSTVRAAAVQDCLRALVTSDVVSHPHHIVPFQYFETVCRYDKFFAAEPTLLPQVLTAFLDGRGMNHPHPRNRARAVYLFSRFTKCLKTQLGPYTETILGRLGGLLSLSTDAESATDGGAGSHLAADDQLYLFETVAVLIVSNATDSRLKCTQLGQLLEPVLTQAAALGPQLADAARAASDGGGGEEAAARLTALQRRARHAGAVAARTTKAFSAGTTMQSVGCVPLYLHVLQTFLQLLQCAGAGRPVQSAVVQLLHRLVVCLEQELLPAAAAACEQLLRDADLRSLQELLPLLNQLLAKHKKLMVPFMTQAFMPLVETIFGCLQRPIDESDHVQRRERQGAQRAYYLFLASVVSNGATPALEQQQWCHLVTVLRSVVDGAVQLTDPVAQRSCFLVLRRCAESWARPGAGPPAFAEFLYEQLVPACVLAPLRPTFDLTDAQTLQALHESAACLRTVYQQRGEELVTFLQSRYMPGLKLEPEAIDGFCQALRTDAKVFRNHTKLFFREVRS